MGLDFDPSSCNPFYEHSEAIDSWQEEDFADKEFYWFSRLDNVHPSMWQIYIEAVATPKLTSFMSAEKFTLPFDIAIAVRGKN